MRGKGSSGCRRRTITGITPAYAGKSEPHGAKATRAGDHPRVCGEKDVIGIRRLIEVGSPPRMRGKDTIQRHIPGGVGITPAYAGKSRFPPLWAQRTRDHPRVCGEKQRLRRAGPGGVGSPPRMRGKALQGDLTVNDGGDHPRVCGEKGGMMVLWAWRWGSPPRMRGKGAVGSGGGRVGGITPAYAGKR